MMEVIERREMVRPNTSSESWESWELGKDMEVIEADEVDEAFVELQT